ncbi:MAG: ACP S-malonyltransferase [Eubacteriales bacterium]|nr:ACP S-malonyltransferase [Eubacteriales bacterium]
MKTAFLFPGQGSQTPGMGADLYLTYGRYREAFDRCEAGANIDLKQACFKGEGMDGSDVIQAAIYTHSLATLRLLEAAGVQADVLAGLSLGEYTALAASGVLLDAQGASLVRRRGAVMDGAVPPGTGGMLSVVGLTLEQVESTIVPFANVFVANHLSETQITLGGLLGELAEAKAALEAAGARMAVMLAMKGPSHCPLLNLAAERFSAELAGEIFGEPSGVVYSNALGAPYPIGADYRALLCAQMNTRVRWHDCIEGMLAGGVTRFVEIGPGGVLTKMLKRRVGRDIALFSVQDEASLKAFLRAEKEGGA